MDPIAAAHDALVYGCPWRALLDVVPACDLLAVDAPYSERTHAGHDDGVESTRLEGEEKRMRVDRRNGAIYSVGVNRRRSITYPYWTPDDVRAFVAAWAPRTRGWFVSITDHVLFPAWEEALAAAGRYIFSPLPYVAPGRGVRLSGDGPSSWTNWICVARPTTRAFSKWGTLPGAYILPPGQGGQLPVVGGKPVWLMQQIVEDYSRPGDLVCDPCAGAGTTLVGAIRLGLASPAQARRAVGGDINPEHAALAARWCANPLLSSPIRRGTSNGRQTNLFGGTP